MELNRLTVWLAILAFVLQSWCDPLNGSFRDEQNRFPRVRAARNRSQSHLEDLFKKAGLTYPPRRIFLRLFKLEAECELWAAATVDGKLTKIKTYAICASSGELGPKRREGDLQVPEGFYHISVFNPYSNFHLSLKINYPNASDRILSDHRRPGGDIFIHGSCVTIGCIPLRDGPIEEIYLAAVDARSNGQVRIPVHIFPGRMGTLKSQLENFSRTKPPLQAFWENLQEGFLYFETKKRLPKITVDGNGRYHFHDAVYPGSPLELRPSAQVEATF
ncbi:MAG: L,D-transpeptidase family protein [Candidatus Aminicenantes bacterium]|nr:L,D-transpeptidase family protein [Candidatus Aminicenantes bacterium]